MLLMTFGAVIIFPALKFHDGDFIGPVLTQNFGLNAGTGYCWCANCWLFTCFADDQNIVERDFITCVAFKAFYSNDIICAEAVLFAAGANYCIHRSVAFIQIAVFLLHVGIISKGLKPSPDKRRIYKAACASQALFNAHYVSKKTN